MVCKETLIRRFPLTLYVTEFTQRIQIQRNDLSSIANYILIRLAPYIAILDDHWPNHDKETP